MGKVTPEPIYPAVDERTEKILEHLKKIERRQEEDFRYLNDKMDAHFAQLNQRIDTQIGQVRNEIAQLNQRIDTVIQLLVNIKKP